ncbi:MAG TPA: AIM24 family protein [Acidimicrobiales bacterium]|nr:AIM24 family protein [Acidimicrobiales bacterium]
MHAEVKGTTLPVLEMVLDPGESVISTHGELSWMSGNMTMQQTMNTGGQSGFLAAMKRVIASGGIFLTHYEPSGGTGMIAFASKMPGRIVPFEIQPGQGYLVHRHGWLCGTPGISPTIGLQQSFRGGLWGGDGFVLEKLEGQGTVWVELAGEVLDYELQPGQTLLVHPGHVGIFQDRVSFQITRLPGIKNIMFGGDGYHLVALTGPGRVWLQSMPLPVLAGALEPYLEKNDAVVGGAAGGLAGGVGGGLLGNILRG